jgi:hypothetical protein
MNLQHPLVQRFAGLAVWLLFLASGVRAQALLTPYNGPLSAEQQAILTNLEAKETTKRVRLATIDMAVFEQDAITLNAFPERTDVARKVDIGTIGTPAQHWVGTFPDRLGTAVFIWFAPNRVQGHITSIDGNFEVFALGEGIYMVAEHDNEKFEACGNESDSPNDPVTPDGGGDSGQPTDPDNDMGLPVQTQHAPQRDGGSAELVGVECFIRVVALYTSGADANTQSLYGRAMNEHVALAIADANASYFNSAVEQRLELAHLAATSDNETSSAATDVTDLRNTTDGKWDEIHSKRDFYDGDMCALITDGGYSGLCGRAYGFQFDDATEQFNVSEYDCIVGNFTLDHELGHHRGCRHDNDGTLTPFSYGHGYNQGSIFRTIMAVCCSPVRVNYWSNPAINFPGGGGAMGTAGFADNESALDVGDFSVARHRTTPSTFSTGINIGSEEHLNMYTTGTLTSTNDFANGGTFVLKSQSRVVLAPGFLANAGSSGRVFIEAPCTASYSRTTDQGTDGPELDPGDLAADVAEFSVVAYPNPFSGTTTLAYELPENSSIRVALYDIRGQEIRVLFQASEQLAGRHTLDINGADLASGTYFIQIMADAHVGRTKLVVSH